MTETADDEEYADDSAAALFPAAIKRQNAEPDLLTGAASTSHGLIVAIGNAPEKAL